MLVSLAARLGALALALTSLPAMAQTGTLVGRVTSALTGAPVATARVTLDSTQGWAPVDAEGRFRFANVRSAHGRYLHAASATGRLQVPFR
ncbi:MAG: carboxypeptidase-like regulatory domain-containing protein [Gemmatimonadaceae bacterium]|nr:carboxypeptidase-like regulatory domain-containing protein [Gemmatimonadaceae bacterium]